MRVSNSLLGVLILTGIFGFQGAFHGASAQEPPLSPNRSVTTDSMVTNFYEEMVITGTRRAQRLADTPVRTELVSRDDIHSIQAGCLADACEFTPGLRVQNNCQNCNFTTLSILGLEGKYSQVLYDGQPIFSGLALVYGLEQIPSRMIDSIEVIKGGGSSLYGPGAVGGVVNIIPHEPLVPMASAQYRLEDMDGSTNYSADFNADVVSNSVQTAGTIFGQSSSTGSYDRDGDGFTEIGQRKASAIGARFKRHLAGEGSVTLDYSHTFEDRRGGDRLDLPPFMSDIAEWIQTWRNSISTSWQQPWSETFTSQVTVAYASTDRKTYYGGGGDTSAYGDTDNPLYLVDAQLGHDLGSHYLTWGVQHSSDTIEDRQPAYERLTDETYTNTGLYVQDEWQISDPLVVVPGVRVDDHNALDDAVISPRLAVRYKQSEVVSWRGSFSTGFLAPQVFDEDLHIAQSGGDAQVIRNIDGLKEESSRSFTLSVTAEPKLGSGYGRFEINAFRTNLKDAFALTDEFDDPTTPEKEFYRINQGKAEVQGVEAATGWMNKRFEFQLGWVFQKAEFNEAQDFDEKSFFRTPESYGVMLAKYNNPRLVDLFVGARFMGEELVPHYAGYIAEDRLETSPTFAVIDFSVTKRIALGDDLVTLVLGGKNITDQYQDDVDQGADRDTGYLYGPRFPRTWYGTVGYEF